MLRTAQAGELVTVYLTPQHGETVGNSQSGEKQAFLLEAHPNPDDGSLMWCPISHRESKSELKEKAEMLAHLQTKKWMGKSLESCECVRIILFHLLLFCFQGPMLNDVRRNKVYKQAIEKAIQRFWKKHRRAPHILDIGTGTGLLAMIAAKAGMKATDPTTVAGGKIIAKSDLAMARSASVTTCEMFPSMVSYTCPLCV